MTSIKRLNEVFRDSKLFAQTKALYGYLWVRADYKSGLSYPPKTQILTELNLTDKLYEQGLQVLINRGYIIPTTKEGTDADGNKYNINCFNIVGDDTTDTTQEVSDTNKSKK